jgi:hypothetical protein
MNKERQNLYKEYYDVLRLLFLKDLKLNKVDSLHLLSAQKLKKEIKNINS